MRAYAEAVHYFLTNREGTAQIVAKYTKVEDRDVVNHAIDSETAALERTLQVDPKGIELILGLISKTFPQAGSAKAQDFYDPRFVNELRDSGFLKKLWGEVSDRAQGARLCVIRVRRPSTSTFHEHDFLGSVQFLDEPFPLDFVDQTHIDEIRGIFVAGIEGHQDIFDSFRLRARRPEQAFSKEFVSPFDCLGVCDLEIFSKNFQAPLFIGLDVVHAFDLPFDKTLHRRAVLLQIGSG